MKHLLLILALLVAGYAAWAFSDKPTRRSAAKLITRHGIRLGFMVAIVLLMLLVAAYLPSTQII